MSGKYLLSYDEQIHAKSQLLAAARLQRLLRVRSQDMELAKSRCRAFQQLCVNSAQALQDKLVELITQQHNAQLVLLRAQHEQSLAGIASAQRDAAANAQQMALERQHKQHVYIQRRKETQERFVAALQRVQSAQQTELQAVLDKIQRRQAIMQSQHDLAKVFTEQQKDRGAQHEKRLMELELLEHQRRRQNQASKIDFKYSRLHEMGVPQLVVNHRELPQQVEDADAATQAQLEAARIEEQFAMRKQQEQEKARKAADRGVSAHMLLQAERNRQRMEQALQEMEINAVQQRQQELTAGRTSAAPLLRKWQQQKRKVQAHRAFEQDFLPDPAAAVRQGLPSFLTTEQPPQAAAVGKGGHVLETAPVLQAAAAERALKLVAELERQRRAERIAAHENAQGQQRCRQQAPPAAASGQPSSAAAPSEIEIPVEVEDLMLYIPPATSQLASSATGHVTETGAAERHALSASADTPQQYKQPIPSVGEDASETAASSLSTSVAAALQENSTIDASMAEAAAAQQSVHSSQDSLAAVMQAADEVLRQLPAEMQAAAAARAAAAAACKLLTTAPAATAESVRNLDEATTSLAEVTSADTVPIDSSTRPHGAAISVQSADSSGSSAEGSRITSSALDSSADAAAILQELHELQQQLGLQVLGSSSFSGDLEQLAAFDAEVDRLMQQQQQQQQTAPQVMVQQPAGGQRAMSCSCQPGTAAARAAARAAAGVQAPPQQQQQQPPAALAASGTTLLGGLGVAQADLDLSSSFEEAEAGSTDLEALIDRILAPDYPATLLGPQPSVSSPTHPAGRSGRRAAAAAAAAPQQQQQRSLHDQRESTDVAAGLREVQQGLMDLCFSGVSLSSINTGDTADVFLQRIKRDLAHIESLDTSSSGTLPRTILGAAAGAAGVAEPAVGRGSAQQQQLQQGLPPLPALLSTSAMSIPKLIAAATTAGMATPQAIRPAATAAGANALMPGLHWSLSTSTEDDEDDILRSFPGWAAAQQQRRQQQTIVQAGSWISSNATSIPSTVLQRAADAAGRQSAPRVGGMAASGAAATAAVAPLPPSTNGQSLPSTLFSLLNAAAAAGAAGGGGGGITPGTSSAVGVPTAEQAKAQHQLLQELLSLRDSSVASSDAGGAATLVQSMGSTGSSSFADEELDQLLQQALAGMSAAAGGGSGVGGSKVAPQQQQQQTTGLSDKLLEILHGPAGMIPAAVGKAASSGSSTASLSTGLPSTIMRQMPAGGQPSISHAAAAAGSPGGSGSSSSSAESSISSKRSAPSRVSCGPSPADMVAASKALKVAKQSSRDCAAAAAAATAAAAGAAQSTVSGVSIPSTIDRQLLLQQGQRWQRQGCKAPSSSLPQSIPQETSAMSDMAANSGAPACTVSSSSTPVSLPSTIMHSMQQQPGGAAAQPPSLKLSGSSSSYAGFSISPTQQQPPKSVLGAGSSSGSSSMSLPSTISACMGAGATAEAESGLGNSNRSSSSSSGRRVAAGTLSAGANISFSTEGNAVSMQPTQVSIQQQQRGGVQSFLGRTTDVLDTIEEEVMSAAMIAGTSSAIAAAAASTPSTASDACLLPRRQPPPLPQQQQQVTFTQAAISGLATTAALQSDSRASGSRNAGVGMSHDDLLSSGSFSDVVSGLMHHIDSTLAFLADASSSSGMLDEPAAAAAGPSGAASAARVHQSARQALSAAAQQGHHHHKQQQGQTAPAGSSSSSSQETGSSNNSTSAPHQGGLGSITFSGVSGGTSCTTGSSTERCIQHTLAGSVPLSPSSSNSSVDAASSATGDDQQTSSLRREATRTTGGVASTQPGTLGTSAAAAAMASRHAAAPPACAAVMDAAAGAGGEVSIRLIRPEPCEAQQQQGFMADLLASLASTASSGNTDQLLGSFLAAVSSGSSSNNSRDNGSNNVVGEVQQASSSTTATAARMPLQVAQMAAESTSTSGVAPQRAVSQQQQQQQSVPATVSSGLSALLASILAQDPELAAQVSSQSLDYM